MTIIDALKLADAMESRGTHSHDLVSEALVTLAKAYRNVTIGDIVIKPDHTVAMLVPLSAENERA